MAQPPRQPRDFEGLLKFCMEATKAEDAPEDPESALRGMDTESFTVYFDFTIFFCN